MQTRESGARPSTGQGDALKVTPETDNREITAFAVIGCPFSNFPFGFFVHTLEPLANALRKNRCGWRRRRLARRKKSSRPSGYPHRERESVCVCVCV